MPSISTYCHVRDGEARINGELLYQHMGDEPFLTALYRHLGIQYPKFFKMDSMSKLGLLGSELVLARSGMEHYADDEIGLVFANSRSSLETDLAYHSTQQGGTPSPSLFVYTLPNIVMGEVCIRHRLLGETAFLVTGGFDAEALLDAALPLLEQGAAKAVLLGWAEADGNRQDGFFAFIGRKGPHQAEAGVLTQLYTSV